MLYSFDEYELDLQRYELRYAGKRVKLEPQVFNVLVYLVQHRHRVVTKEELLEQLWPGRFVGEASLTSRLLAARRAIGDRGREQRLIQTVHGRGYRFIAPVEERVMVQAPHGVATALPNVTAPPSTLGASRPVQAVGREAELAQLHRWLQRALQGTRQLAFVTGEAGLGKTTLVEMFLHDVGGPGALRIGRGQCIEHYGVGEAYLPVLEALGGLCKEPGGQELIALLARQAPTWVVQMPWLVTDVELAALQSRVMGATQERMLREMAEALAAWTAEQPLMLVLEDLHWSDHATLDLLAWLARRQEPARLLVVGTYRPADVTRRGHPLHAVVHELQMHKRCEELSLTWLTEAAVEKYLTTRFPGTTLPDGLARLLHQRTEGNPLFMVTVVDAWEAQGWLEEVEGTLQLRMGLGELAQRVPESLRQMLEQQLDQLRGEEQGVLEAASVAGVEFSAAAVAAGLETDVVEAETRCESLARRQSWLRSVGSDAWPDGTVAGRYAFIHALYQHVVSQRLAAARRIYLHRRIGERLETAYGARAPELAVDLAGHFVRGRDPRRAVQYLRQAAETALQRHAYREAVDHLMRALDLLPLLSDARERAHQELAVQLALGSAFVATQGAGASDVEQAYTRAKELGQQVGETSRLCLALLGLAWVSLVRGQAVTARELAAQALEHVQAIHDSIALASTHAILGSALSFLGGLEAARGHLEQSIAFYHARQSHFHSSTVPEDLEVFCLARLAEVLWSLGYPDQALRRSQEALHLADELSSPSSLAVALTFAARLHQYRREVHQAYAQAEAALALAREQQFALRQAQAMVLRGWALVMQGHEETGMTQLHQGLAAVRATGEGVEQPYRLALLAEAYAHVGQPDVGLQVLAEALVLSHASGEHRWMAELYRLKGELLLAQVGEGQQGKEGEEAEVCFQQALATARRQGTKSLELRTAVSLGRLWQQQGKHAEALQLLAEIYGWFTEGFDTADLQEAKALLDEWS